MPSESGWPDGRRITISDLQAATDRGERWSMLTSYDALTAGVFEQAGVRALLVGDTSAEMVLGFGDTLPVTMDQMITMVQAVVRGTRTAPVVADLPFGSVRGRPGVGASRTRTPGLRRAAHPDCGHRRRTALRRPDHGLAGHGRAHDWPGSAIRQALRRHPMLLA